MREKNWQRTCCSISGSFTHCLSKLEMGIAFPTPCVYSRSSWKHWIQSFVHHAIPELCPLPWRTCHVPSTFHTEWLHSQLISLLMQPFCSWNAQAENIHWFYLTKGLTKLRIKSRIRSVFPMNKIHTCTRTWHQRSPRIMDKLIIISLNPQILFFFLLLCISEETE